MGKQNLKTIEIKGKSYVTVAERLRYFNETYPNSGSITTELLTKPEEKLIVVKASVKINDRIFTGHSQAIIGDGYINKTSALENAETSAVGRALGMMGIGIIESVASVDEMVKAGAYKPKTTHTEAKRLEAEINFEMNEQAALDEAVKNGDLDKEELELVRKL